MRLNNKDIPVADTVKYLGLLGQQVLGHTWTPSFQPTLAPGQELLLSTRNKLLVYNTVSKPVLQYSTAYSYGELLQNSTSL